MKPTDTSFLWKGIWQTKAPLQVTFFAWKNVPGRNLTMDNLKSMLLID